jgi:ethanolamine utilization microcompartment shell protein EutS
MEDVARVAGMVAQVAELYDSICKHIDVLYKVGDERFNLARGRGWLSLGEFSIVLPEKLVKSTEMNLGFLDVVTGVVEWIDGKCDTAELSVSVKIDDSNLEMYRDGRRIVVIRLSAITPVEVLFLYALEKSCGFISELLERMQSRCDILKKAVELLEFIATSLGMLGGGKSGNQS